MNSIFVQKLKLSFLKWNNQNKKGVFVVLAGKKVSFKSIYFLGSFLIIILCSSCGREFPPGGKPIDVSKTTDGITMKMTIGKKSYSGKVECDSESKAKNICENYKVLVYVETDKLYIHPYLGSYATIDTDGLWRVSKVDRDPPPSAVYAFLVRKNAGIPDALFNKDELNYIAYVEWFEK